MKLKSNLKSFWKLSKVQLNQLKSVKEAYYSIINSFNAYASNHSYDDGIKALTKSSYEFIDAENKKEAKAILKFAFNKIESYYSIITLDKVNQHNYIYECIDKYIDLLFSEEAYNESADTSKKISQLIEKEQMDEKRLICKYYGFQAISELLNENENNFENTVKKGIELETDDIQFCTNIYKLVSVVRQKNEENEKLIKRLFNEISRQVPSSIAKMMNIKFIQENKFNNNYINEIKTDLSEEDEDLK